jgi:hypothetical protein
MSDGPTISREPKLEKSEKANPKIYAAGERKSITTPGKLTQARSASASNALQRAMIARHKWPSPLAIGATRLLFKTAAQTKSYEFYPFDVSGDGQSISR